MKSWHEVQMFGYLQKNNKTSHWWKITFEPTNQSTHPLSPQGTSQASKQQRFTHRSQLNAQTVSPPPRAHNFICTDSSSLP